MIKTEQRPDGLFRVILNQPKKRNALSWDMTLALRDAIAEAMDNKACRCLEITGAGTHFCAGRDLSDDLAPRDLNATMKRDDCWTEIYHMLDTAKIPSVAVVRGVAAAGGFTLSMGCDFVIATRATIFQVSEMQLNFPAAINTPVLSRLVGPRIAQEWLLLAEPIPASRLYELGLINRLVDADEELEAVAADFIGILLQRDATAVKLTKELHHAARNAPHADALNMGKLLNALIAASGQFAAAAEQFAARRKKADN